MCSFAYAQMIGTVGRNSVANRLILKNIEYPKKVVLAFPAARLPKYMKKTMDKNVKPVNTDEWC